jgi:hypothetical protein
MTDRHLEPHQARTRPQTDFENALGDSIEEAYAAGIHDLEGVVGHLVAHGPPPEGGGSWTVDGFTALMAELGR